MSLFMSFQKRCMTLNYIKFFRTFDICLEKLFPFQKSLTCPLVGRENHNRHKRGLDPGAACPHY